MRSFTSRLIWSPYDCCGFIVYPVSDWFLSVCSGEGTGFSERAVQSVVVVFEVLQLQEVSGPLAPLLHRRGEVVALSGGGGGAGGLRAAAQVFGRGLVALAGGAAVARPDAGNNGGESRRITAPT